MIWSITWGERTWTAADLTVNHLVAVAAKTFITGLTDGDQISISGPYDVVIHTQLTALKAAQSAGSAAAAYIWGPGGSVAAQARSAGSAYVASYSVSSAVGGRVEYSGEFANFGCCDQRNLLT